MKNALRYALWITLLVAICAGVWMGNLALGRTRGEIDYGVWHEIESRGGAGYYYLKGVDQANRYLDSNSAMAMISQTPSYRQSLTDKYGALVDRRGWLGDATISAIPWKLFDTEAEATAI